MPIPFAYISRLLCALEDLEDRRPPILPAYKKNELIRATIEQWFQLHRRAIDDLDEADAIALLSSLLPERRTDRVYGLQARGLGNLLCRALDLRIGGRSILRGHLEPGNGDLGECVERYLRRRGPPGRPPVLVAEIDTLLQHMAGRCRFSSSSVRAIATSLSSRDRDNLLSNIFSRLDADEGKWLVRLILKDFAPVTISEHTVLQSFHFLLPDLLRFQNSFEVSIALLRDQFFRQYPARPDPRSVPLHRKSVAHAIKPRVGVKIGRLEMDKARGIDSCFRMLGPHGWVIERKYDGEYCEIHVDLTQSATPKQCITIFSKSAKESTHDRGAILDTLVKCLGLGTSHCRFQRQAIFLGELVVYSDEQRCVLPFDKIRKHVSRSGSFLGTDQDSQVHADEHLAIVFFDLLLLDDEVVMNKPVEERRTWLRESYTKVSGRAWSAEWKIVNFAEGTKAKTLLIKQFAASMVERCEGLVLKPCSVPYFCLAPPPNGIRTRYIKLKQDYIDGMGDEADLAVIGASYDAQQALKSGLPGVRWTDFHLGCIVNAEDVRRFDARPLFQVVYTVQQHACIPKPVLKQLNTLGSHRARAYTSDIQATKFDVQTKNYDKMDVIFNEPFVLEVLGSGFSKPSNCDFYMLRHARAKKLHHDRSWKDCVTFQALQNQAESARNAPQDSESQATKDYVDKLQCRMKRKLESQGTLSPRSRGAKTPSTVAILSPESRTGQTTHRTSRKRSAAHNEAELSDMDGSTLVEKDSKHETEPRKAGLATPCPPPKRHCSRDTTAPLIPAQPHPTPLADITNQVPDRPNICTDPTQSPTPPPRPQHKPAALLPPPLTPPSTPEGHCTSPRCLLHHTVVHLAPCIANTPYITQDLLAPHSAVRAQKLTHWDRDSDSHAPGTETVSESQAWAERRKLVLVERRRVDATRGVVGRVVALNRGRLGERIELWDWRVLEKCAGHDVGAEEVKGDFIGATVVGVEGTVFVSGIPEFTVVG
ncbi:DNA ligase N terminus [Teratosphaeria destructans]|uniref:DNA ligase N terminus n=1 Tax=Teratosphaeria destructans TaxID=418781 RepID=A0A9W7SUR5_9PEZI|nr:DNA ligase N terminus [Teratosphaeria destructans]